MTNFDLLLGVTVSFRRVRFWCDGAGAVIARHQTNRPSFYAFCFLWRAPFPGPFKQIPLSWACAYAFLRQRSRRCRGANL